MDEPLNKSGNRRGLHGKGGRKKPDRPMIKVNRWIYEDQLIVPSSFIREAIDEKLNKERPTQP